MKKKYLLVLTLAVLFLSSCSTPNVAYFNDLENGQTEKMLQKMAIRLRSGDKVSIVVNSKDPLLADLFNLPVYTHRIVYNQAYASNASQNMSVYTVDKDGEIDFPVV